MKETEIAGDYDIGRDKGRERENLETRGDRKRWTIERRFKRLNIELMRNEETVKSNYKFQV